MKCFQQVNVMFFIAYCHYFSVILMFYFGVVIPSFNSDFSS